MDQPQLDTSEMTLWRFCRWRKIPLDHAQRSAVGVLLSQRAAERQLPRRTVKERIDDGSWSKSRLYPRAFLEEWLSECRAAGPTPKDVSTTPTTNSPPETRRTSNHLGLKTDDEAALEVGEEKPQTTGKLFPVSRGGKRAGSRP